MGSLLLWPSGTALAQDDLRFTASVDRTELGMADQLSLELVLSGTFRGASAPELPVLPGLRVLSSGQSSQFRMVNGALSSQVVYWYRLQPTEAGTHTIPAIAIRVGNRELTSAPITIQVAPGQGMTSDADASATQAPEGAMPPQGGPVESLWAQAEIDNPSPIVGQQVIYTFRLYQAVELFGQPRLDLPEYGGCLVYDLPNRSYLQRIEGRAIQVTEVRRALIPMSAGEVTIAPATLEVPGDLLNRGIRLQTEAQSLDVRPYPAGAPADFAGAVGRFDIEAWAEPEGTQSGEPVTLYLRVRGHGNLELVSDPLEAILADLERDWRVYDVEVSTDLGTENDLVSGERVFARPLLPKAEGTLTIPSLAMTFFDPELGVYRSVAAEPVLVHVTPAGAQAGAANALGATKSDVMLVGSDIRHIKPAPPLLTTRRASPLKAPLYWAAWILAPAAVVGLWGWDRRRRRLATDVAALRAHRAQRLARSRLSEARRLLRDGREDEGYGTLARALTGYLGDKLNLTPSGLTRDGIRAALAEANVRPRLVERILLCLERADSGRFAPGVPTGEGLERLIDEARSLVAEIERGLGA
ncbi:MAG: protein BatD [Anaerolineae bacterium]|nr:protein BatD [Anaerolineae bacterium]